LIPNAPVGFTDERCRLDNTKTTLRTWGCFYYAGTDEALWQSACAREPSPSDAQFEFLGYDTKTRNERSLNQRMYRRLKAPWSDCTHSRVVYPWKYNELALEPLAPFDAALKEPDVVKFLRILDFKDSISKGAATMDDGKSL
jgi:hypothetical protein